MRDQSPILPAKVLVTFASVWTDDFPAPTSMPVPYEISVLLSTVIGSVVGIAAGTAGVDSRSKIFHTIAPALFDLSHTSTPSNNTALQALANKIATDFYSWRCLGYYDRAINGSVGYLQDGLCDVEWTYEAGDQRARAASWPRTDEPEEFLHIDKVDPTLPGFFYRAKTGAGGIGAATSATQATGATVTFYKEDVDGAFTVLNDAYGSPVTRKAWNWSTTGAVAGNTHIGVTREATANKWVATLVPC